jgi:soluble lytic murein transglycosylase
MVALVSAPTAGVWASPDAPMCVSEQPLVSPAPIELIRWRMPMCGPFAPAAPSPRIEAARERAIEAYREATDGITTLDYDRARLKLDLALRGLPEIKDRIALESGRLELLRNRAETAAEFFAQAESSPHESVRVRASFGRVYALLRADDPKAHEALEQLLETYPEVPERNQLLLEHARSMIRQQRYEDALVSMRRLQLEAPASDGADWAKREMRRLRSVGYDAPQLTHEERVRAALTLMNTGPLDKARSEVKALLELPMAGELHADAHYLAGKLARFEGRWQASETYLRTAQLFSAATLLSARTIELRADDMSRTAGARDPMRAERALSELRAGRKDSAIPSATLIDMISVAAAAGLSTEVDGLLRTIGARKGLSDRTLFDAAMASMGVGSLEVVVPLLESVARQAYSKYRAAALYHLARAYEEAGRREAEVLYVEASRAAEETEDDYYALWSTNGLRNLTENAQSDGREGLSPPIYPDVPGAPGAETGALVALLEPIAERHAETYPWIARATDLLHVGETEAATEELFETYLQWRQALGRPIARAGLACVASDDSRANPEIPNELRDARLELSDEERMTLSRVAATLGDVGTAGGFAGPDFIDSLPRAYEWLIVPAARRHGLDPNLLLAVMRVESAYQKHIVSYAGAVGLLQIMPRTGRMIAHALERDGFTPADLLDPETNLEFGAWYLASLIRRFDGHLPLAVAAYNGGPHNVRRWMQESSADTPLDVLLERIPFSQTHRYVRKVLVHYRAYRAQLDLPMPQLSTALPEPRVDPLAF